MLESPGCLIAQQLMAIIAMFTIRPIKYMKPLCESNETLYTKFQ